MGFSRCRQLAINYLASISQVKKIQSREENTQKQLGTEADAHTPNKTEVVRIQPANQARHTDTISEAKSKVFSIARLLTHKMSYSKKKQLLIVPLHSPVLAQTLLLFIFGWLNQLDSFTHKK